MGEKGGIALSQLMAGNTKITRLTMESNTVHHKHIEEVQFACTRNKQIEKKTVVPKFKQELGDLIELTALTHKQEKALAQVVQAKLHDKRQQCLRKIKTLGVEKTEHVKGIYEGEDMVSDLLLSEQEQIQELLSLKEANAALS